MIMDNENISYTNMVTAAVELVDGLVTPKDLLKALAMSWKAEGDEAGVWLGFGSSSRPECVCGLSASVSV